MRSFEAAEFAGLEWTEGFNDLRRIEPIGNVTSPESRVLRQIEVDRIAAWHVNKTAGGKPGAVHSNLGKGAIGAIGTSHFGSQSTSTRWFEALIARELAGQDLVPRPGHAQYGGIARRYTPVERARSRSMPKPTASARKSESIFGKPDA